MLDIHTALTINGESLKIKDRRKTGALQNLSTNDAPFRGKNWEHAKREDRRKKPGGGYSTKLGINIPRLCTMTFICRLYTCIAAAVGAAAAAAVFYYVFAFVIETSNWPRCDQRSHEWKQGTEPLPLSTSTERMTK